MFSFTRKNDVECAAFRIKQSKMPFSYLDVFCTKEKITPSGYDEDHSACILGEGEECFQAACQALKEWKQFPSAWTWIEPWHPPIQTGTTVNMQAKTNVFYTLNACRIIYTIQEDNRFGFAYGTLPGHVEMGEELFLVELANSGEVRYTIKAISRPRHILSRLFYPIARYYQAKFRKDSCLAMKEYVADQLSKNKFSAASKTLA